VLIGLYIFVDDDFQDPVYADPEGGDLDEGVYESVCEAINDAIEGDGPANGHLDVDDVRVCWRYQSRIGLSMAAVVDPDIGSTVGDRYLKALFRQYLDEVDNPRDPERDGVADVVVDVIPPWEDED